MGRISLLETLTRVPSRAINGVPARSIVAAMIGVAFMGSGLITPLYAIYQRAFHFPEITLTLVYAAYALGNLAALLFLGRMSDCIGRRAVGVASVVLGCASMLLFLFAESTIWLFFARILSGVAVGLASGAGTAWLADLDEDKSRATTIATLANAIGFALGPLLGGLLAQCAAPLRTPFFVYIPALAAVGALVALTRETVDSRGRKADLELLRPRVGVPKEIVGKFIAPAVTCFVTFALVGFYAGLIPTVLKQDLHESSPAVAGSVVFELALAAGIVAYAGRRVGSRAAMLGALVVLLPCVALLLAAQASHSLPLLLVASALGGVCWGLGIRGSLNIVNDIAPADRRGEVTSSYYIAGFAGNSIPVIGVGLISAAANSWTASLTFGCTIALFAVAAVVVGLRYPAKP